MSRIPQQGAWGRIADMINAALVRSGTAATQVMDSVASSTALPTAGNTAGDVRLAEDTDRLWLWDGTAWVDSGPVGVPGQDGSDATVTDATVAAAISDQTHAVIDSRAAAYVTHRPIRVSDYGALGTGDDSATISAALGASLGRTLIFPAGATLNTTQNVLSNKHHVTIDGNGATLQLLGTGARQAAIRLYGTVEHVTIRNLHVVGSGTATDLHAGVYAYNDTVRDVTVTGCRFEDVTIGVSFSAEGSGLIDGVVVDGNYLNEIVGTGAGQGYGVHVQSTGPAPVAATIRGNTIRGARRHGVYVAGGRDVVAANNHLIACGTSGLLNPSVAVLRSHHVDVSGNIIHSPYGGGVTLSSDSATSSGMSLRGNIVTAQADTSPALTIGGNGNADSPQDVIVADNRLDFTSRAIRVYMARNLLVTGNMLRGDSASSLSAVELNASGDTSGTATLTDRLAFIGNVFAFSGAGTHRGVRLAGAETSIASLIFRGNTYYGHASEFIGSANVTNPNVTVVDQAANGLSWGAGNGVKGGPYIEAGALKYRGASGTVTTIAPA